MARVLSSRYPSKTPPAGVVYQRGTLRPQVPCRARRRVSEAEADAAGGRLGSSMRSLAVLVGLTFLWSASLWASEAPKPRISGLTLTFEGDRVLTSFGLRHGFDEFLRERIESGLATTVFYELDLVRDRQFWRFWIRRQVRRNRLEVTAKYDVLTMEYRVNFKLDDKLIDSRIFQDLAGVERAMTSVLDLPAFTLEDKDRAEPLTLRVRADLGSRTILSLVPTRITTDWAESSRFFVPR